MVHPLIHTVWGDPASAEGRAVRDAFLPRWRRCNNVWSLLGTVAATLLAVSLAV